LLGAAANTDTARATPVGCVVWSVAPTRSADQRPGSLPTLRPQRHVRDDAIALRANEAEHRWRRRVPGAEPLPGEGKRNVVGWRLQNVTACS